MSYSSQTINNKFFIKRTTHLKRFEVTKKLIDLKETDTYLDFGTGNGYLLKLLAKKTLQQQL
jgi:cyclopropane fatty-acyl-phospholipid synthase-like methyltransferase